MMKPDNDDDNYDKDSNWVKDDINGNYDNDENEDEDDDDDNNVDGE